MLLLELVLELVLLGTVTVGNRDGSGNRDVNSGAVTGGAAALLLPLLVVVLELALLSAGVVAAEAALLVAPGASSELINATRLEFELVVLPLLPLALLPLLLLLLLLILLPLPLLLLLLFSVAELALLLLVELSLLLSPVVEIKLPITGMSSITPITAAVVPLDGVSLPKLTILKCARTTRMMMTAMSRTMVR